MWIGLDDAGVVDSGEIGNQLGCRRWLSLLKWCLSGKEITDQWLVGLLWLGAMEIIEKHWVCVTGNAATASSAIRILHLSQSYSSIFFDAIWEKTQDDGSGKR